MRFRPSLSLVEGEGKTATLWEMEASCGCALEDFNTLVSGWVAHGASLVNNMSKTGVARCYYKWDGLGWMDLWVG